MGGAAKTAARREICKFTTSAHAASSEMMPKRISLRFAQTVTEQTFSLPKCDEANRLRDASNRSSQYRAGAAESICLIRD
jgi:hypothetical protein